MPSPPNFRIKTLTAFVTIDPNDNSEGIVSFASAMGPMPMIGADDERIESLHPLAEQIAQANGCRIKLVRFSVREDIETIEPKDQNSE